MKKKLLALALFASSSTVFAQAANFEGFTAGINVSSIGASTSMTVDGDRVSFGQQNFVPSVELGYNFAATKEIVLGLTATYDFTKTNAGELGPNYTAQLENRYSINFKPGYAVSQNALVYATVGYNSGTGKITNVDGTKTFTGIGYGFGTALMIDKNIFIKAEVQRIDFDSQNAFGDVLNVKPSATVGTIGIGYKF